MACTKKRYKDELDAKIALALIQGAKADSKDKRTEARVYRCKPCRAWHLTSLR